MCKWPILTRLVALYRVSWNAMLASQPALRVDGR
jgi:hypothetical protein